MAIPAGAKPAGGCPVGGGATIVIASSDSSVTVVEGPPGTFNITVSASDIPYTPLFPETGDASASVGDELGWRENHVGTAAVVASEPMLEAAAPVGAVTPGAHTIAGATWWTTPVGGAPIDVAANQVELVHPGSIHTVAPTKVLLTGSNALPLVFGEVVADGLTILNTGAGEDVSTESLSGRQTRLDSLTTLGAGGVRFDDILGPNLINAHNLVAPAPGSTGFVLDGTIGAWTCISSIFQAPGGADWTAIKVEPTAMVAALFNVQTSGFASARVGDAMVNASPLASYPTGPLPTTIIGMTVTGDSILGPGSAFAAGSVDELDVRMFSAGHLDGPSTLYIGDGRFTAAGDPSARLDHTGFAGLPLIIPFDNSQNGGAGPTLRTIAQTASSSHHTLLLATVTTSSIAAGGTYTGADGDYPANQASTSGAGTGFEATVTLAAGTITAIVNIDKSGTGYAVGDTITLAVDGPAETVAAVLDVDVIGWVIRTDIARSLSGPVRWAANVARGGGAGSTAFGYIARRSAGVGSFVEVDGSRSEPVLLVASNTRVGGSAQLADIRSGDEWTIQWVNNVVGSATTDFDLDELLVVGQP